jgi:hypothetical protein
MTRLLLVLSLIVLGIWPSGVGFSADDVVVEAVADEPAITAADRAHWSFRPLSTGVLPHVRDAGWCRTGVDRFILLELEARELRPMPEADRWTLIRRVTLDLTGLPPTTEEINAFLADDRPEAYERLVDRLLASPGYGEREAMYWLDLARFAETDGFEHDHVRPEAWRYRDWVIEALNSDLPYDRFVALQLAGDEIAPDDAAARVATGFLVAGPDMPDINLQEERRHVLLNGMTANVGEVFLALQFGCCQCHDHKADPLSQRDFYRLRACFDTIDLFGDEKLQTSASDEPEIVGKNSRVVRTSTKSVEPSRVWVRGDFRRPGPEVVPAVPRVAVSDDGRAPLSQPEAARRSQLAEWIIAAENPLAARVLVNRVWQQHFGVGLAETPSDFGLMGVPPSHPELLDWLAAEFVRSGWSLKELHRLLVTSAVYRLASRPVESAAAARDVASDWEELLHRDPENRWLGRARRRRLEGEAIRDALLSIAGELNREAGGPGMRPPLPEEIVRTLLKDQWPVTPEVDQHSRRSIYLFVRRNLKYPLFDVFDRPDQNLSCSRRMETTIAPQALAMLNSEFTQECAARLAERLEGMETLSDAERMGEAWLITLGRPPSAEELSAAELFVAGEESGWRDLCMALVNLSEFVYVD